MVNDHLSDFITRIRNAYSAKLDTMEVPYTKSIEKVAKVMEEEGFVGAVKKDDKKVIITLKYIGKEPAMTGIKRISKPGARIYSHIKNVPKVLGGLGINILTTPKGIMSEIKARKLNTGGELIAQIW